jgi:hypothetical protein
MMQSMINVRRRLVLLVGLLCGGTCPAVVAAPSAPTPEPSTVPAPAAAAPAFPTSAPTTELSRAPAPTVAAPAFPTSVEEPPDTLDYDPARPVPDGYVLRRRVRRGLVIPGSIVFGVGYALSFAAAMTDKDQDIEKRWLMLPVLGPLVAMATQHKTCNLDTGTPICEKDDATIIVLATLFSMQAVGAALFTWGVASPRERLERKAPIALTLGPSPIGHSGYGVAALGEF